ncbi:MAG TPA: HEAT repeat domain-containing protein, partial [Myxococcales bacterium]|nr:HEAT repeat domain-containing protein [Myxococcales bacterium]
ACGPTREDELAALSSPEASARAQAIAHLGATGDDDNLGDIIAHVGDPDMLVRSSVAAALGNYDDRRSADALGELAADPVESVQVIAVRSLAREKNPRAKAYLLLAYRRDGSSVRAAVAEGLRRAGGDPAEAIKAEAKATWEELSSALTKGDPVERAGAAEELGRSGRAEAVQRLGPYVAADSRSLACSAATGLGASERPEALEPLEAMLSEEDPDLQAAGLAGLQTLGNADAVPAIAHLALKGGRIGLEAVDVLGQLPGRGKGLCDAAQSDDAQVAARAAALVAGAKCDPAPFLAKLSRGADQQRAGLAALAALGGTLADADARRVQSLLRSGGPEVRPMAARAVGVFHLVAAAADVQKAYDEAKARLAGERERWIKDPLPKRYAPGFEARDAIGGTYRDHVTELMGKLAAQGAHVDEDGLAPVGPLFTADTADDAALFAEAAAALAALGQPGAAEAVKALAADPSPEVRLVACRASLSLPPEVGWPLLAGLTGDADPDVRRLALKTAPRLLAKAGPAEKKAGVELFASLVAHPDGTADDVAVEGLTALGAGAMPPSALTPLVEALQRPDTAAVAALALEKLESPSTADAALAERLRSGNPPALPQILDRLGELKASGAAPAIRPFLYHVNPAVRAAAARALLAMGDAASKADVEALQQDYYVEVRRAAGEKPAAVPAPPAAASAEK